MARRKKGEEQAELGAAKSVAAPVMKPQAAAVAVMEYQPLTTEGLWRVDRWQELLVELDLKLGAEEMAAVHAMVQPHPRAWKILRRLFGIGPVMLRLEDDPEECRVLGRDELCASLGIDRKGLDAELMSVRTMVRQALGGQEKAEEVALAGPKHAPKSGVAAVAQGFGLGEGDDELLARHGYARQMFEVPVWREGQAVPRSSEENNAERKWFAGRVRTFEKLLLDPMAGRVADQLLRNDLRLKRAEHELMSVSVGSPMYDKLLKVKAELEETCSRQVKQLSELAPWFNTTEKAVQAKDAFSEAIRAIQEYQSRGDTQLIDGLFTAYELQVLVRTSVQKPEPEYRMGWVQHVLDSRRWLWDARARSRFKPQHLKLLDEGFKAGAQRAIERDGMHVPDLLKEGPQGEYEDIFVPGGEINHRDTESTEKKGGEG